MYGMAGSSADVHPPATPNRHRSHATAAIAHIAELLERNVMNDDH